MSEEQDKDERPFCTDEYSDDELDDEERMQIWQEENVEYPLDENMNIIIVHFDVNNEEEGDDDDEEENAEQFDREDEGHGVEDERDGVEDGGDEGGEDERYGSEDEGDGGGEQEDNPTALVLQVPNLVNGDDDDNTNNNNVIIEPPVKRKRGRPKKSTAEKSKKTKKTRGKRKATADNLSEWLKPVTWEKDGIFNSAFSTTTQSKKTTVKNVNINAFASPFQILKQFITATMVDKICTETNSYASIVKEINPKALPKWKNLTPDEFWKFISIKLLMGIIRKPSINSYWSTKGLTATPQFGEIMSRDRFRDISRALHFGPNEGVDFSKDRSLKLGTFFTDLMKNFEDAIDPGEYICVDETMVPHKGRLAFKQYIPKKAAQWGIKLLALGDCQSGMIIKLVLYQGTTTQYAQFAKDLKLGAGPDATLTLIEKYLDKDHKLTQDNYFNGVPVTKYLLSRKTGVLGTCRRNRVNLPNFGKLEKGQCEFYASESLLVEHWSDRKEVIMINSHMSHEMKNIQSKYPTDTKSKPASVLKYNETMGVIDVMDQLIKPYGDFDRKGKWYIKVFHFLVMVAVYNSFRLYLFCREKSKYPFLKFLENLIQEIRDETATVRPRKGRPCTNVSSSLRKTGNHFPSSKTNENNKKSQRQCELCSLRKLPRKDTTTYCKSCEVFLCLKSRNNSDKSCFELYHTLEKLPEKTRVNNKRKRQEEDDYGRQHKL